MKNTLNNTWLVLVPWERRRFVVLALAGIVISIADIFFLFLLLWIIQFYIQPEASDRLSFLPHWLANRNSILAITLFFFLFSLKNIIAYWWVQASHRFNGDVAIRISENNLTRYQQGSFEEYVKVDSSAYLRKIAFQPFEFCQHILSGIQQMITQACLIFITIVAIAVFQLKLFLLLVCVLLPPVILVFYFIKKRLSRTRLQLQSANETSYRYLLDALKGYVEGNIYERNNFFRRRFLQARKQFSRNLFETLSLQIMPSRVIEIFAVMGLFILVAVAQWNGDSSGATFITIGAFMAAAYKIIPGLVKLINVVGQMKAYEFSFSDFEKAGKTGSANASIQNQIHSIELRDVSFQYNGHSLIHNFSLSMRKGDFIGINGRSGKGKTTLINLMLGFLSNKSGSMMLNDEAMYPELLHSYWPSIAYVRQQNFLIHDTILRNITLQENEFDAKRLDYAMQASGLRDVIQEFPEGLHKVIAENGKNISGGQQQRIALARALYKNADLILLDEPFNELDEASEKNLLEHFRGVASDGRIVVMITHNSRSLQYCTKTVCLDEN